jgi:hypothetical protein
VTTTIDTAVPTPTTTARRTVPFGAGIAAAGLVLGSAGNTLQPLLGQVLGGRPEKIEDQIRVFNEHQGLVTALCLSGTLAVPFMAVGFIAAAHLLARRARRTGVVAGTLLLLGMFGFMAVQTTELVQLAAMTDPDGAAAATWMDGLDGQPLLGVVFGIPFMAGCVLGMLTLTIGLLVKGGMPRWIPATWLAFIVLDFSIGAVGPVDPHWLYFAGALGLAHHVTRDRARAWRDA